MHIEINVERKHITLIELALNATLPSGHAGIVIVATAVVVVVSVAASAMLLVGMTNDDDREVSISSVVDDKIDH